MGSALAAIARFRGTPTASYAYVVKSDDSGRVRVLVHPVAVVACPLCPALEGRQPFHLERRELDLAAQEVVELRGERRHRLAGQKSLQRFAEGLHGRRRCFERAGILAGEVGRIGRSAQLVRDLRVALVVHLVGVEQRQAHELRHRVGAPAPRQPAEGRLGDVVVVLQREVKGRDVFHVHDRRGISAREMSLARTACHAALRPVVARKRRVRVVTARAARARRIGQSGVEENRLTDLFSRRQRGTVCGGIRSTTGGSAAGRNASDAREPSEFEVEPEAISGAGLLHAAERHPQNRADGGSPGGPPPPARRPRGRLGIRG